MSLPCSKVCLEKSFIFAFKQGLVLTYITSSNRWFTQHTTYLLKSQFSLFDIFKAVFHSLITVMVVAL